MGYDRTYLDELAIYSVGLSLANYYENLSQSDKDDIMHALDEQTKSLLQGVNEKLNEQNRMLERILELVEGQESEAEV